MLHQPIVALMSDLHATILEKCKTAGLRRTKSLSALIETLIEVSAPTTLAELADSKQMVDLCDKVTVYRLLQRLEEKGIVRRLGLHERSAYFALVVPGRHCTDYLICTECNSIEPIKAACPVHALEREIAESSGFQNLYHELEFFGVCPDCVAS